MYCNEYTPDPDRFEKMRKEKKLPPLPVHPIGYENRADRGDRLTHGDKKVKGHLREQFYNDMARRKTGWKPKPQGKPEDYLKPDSEEKKLGRALSMELKSRNDGVVHETSEPKKETLPEKAKRLLSGG